MKIEIFEIVKLVLQVVLIALTAFVVPALKIWIQANTTKKQQEEALFWTKIAVSMAEQIFQDKGQGKIKKEYVIAWLNKNGIKISEEQISFLIDMVVVEFKKMDGTEHWRDKMKLKPTKDYPKITSPYGPRRDPFRKTSSYHNGVDIRAEIGTPLLAVAKGKVVVSKTNGDGVGSGYGHYVVVEHDGYCALYAHLRELSKVRVGQYIKKGDIVGFSGNTGKSTGPHLHFEIRQGSYGRDFWEKDSRGKFKNSVDPEKFQPKERWKEILYQKTSQPEDWIAFVLKNRSDSIGRFLPELIVKIEEK